VGKIAEKADCRSGFFTTWHCILSAKRTPSDCFFGDFAHWAGGKVYEIPGKKSFI